MGKQLSYSLVFYVLSRHTNTMTGLIFLMNLLSMCTFVPFGRGVRRSFLMGSKMHKTC